MSGSTLSYRRAHKGVCSSLPLTEYVELVEVAHKRGMTPTAFATQAVRDAMIVERAKADDFEDCVAGQVVLR